MGRRAANTSTAKPTESETPSKRASRSSNPITSQVSSESPKKAAATPKSKRAPATPTKTPKRKTKAASTPEKQDAIDTADDSELPVDLSDPILESSKNISTDLQSQSINILETTQAIDEPSETSNLPSTYESTMVLDDSTQTISSSIDDLVSADLSTESIQPETVEPAPSTFQSIVESHTSSVADESVGRGLHKRKSVSDDMDNNPEAKKRSKRMFQMLVGTLQTAKKDQDTNMSEAAIRRQTIEQRLAEKLVKEKAELADRIKKEREAVIEKRRLTEQKIKDISEEIIESQKKCLEKFIFTKASPGVYFMPANHNDRTKKALVSAITVKTEAVSNADQPSSHTSIISV
ncbi:hypothetical protein O5D80_001209 [Batrachochytrium dendrobatidis]|nr:hypothetical protein O5D80_001209 [Batrachochytrium dendrobatidis]